MPGSPLASPESVVVQPNGQIVVLSNVDTILGASAGTLPPLIRLNSDGSRDTTISQAGLTAAGIAISSSLAVEPNGQLLVFGNMDTTSDTATPIYGSPVLARLNTDGTLDATATLPAYDPAPSSPTGIYGFALQPDGDVAILADASLTGPNPPATVLRLTANLTPDVSFGTDGVSTVTTNAPAGSLPFTDSALSVSPANQIILLGANHKGGGTFYLSVTRLTASAPAVPGDYTGDGISDVAVYLPASGSFAIRPSSGGPDEIIPFGIPGVGQTIPAPGDYTGSGVTEIAAYLPSQGVYAYRPADGGPDVLQAFGIPGAGQSIPAPGDYFGTGQDDIAVYMPSIGSFGIRNPNGGPDEIIPFGIPGAGQSIPAPGDYFGTGVTDLAVYLPSIGAFAIRNPAGGPDEIIPFGTPGLGMSIPIPGDYDGSGKTELAVYIPSQGVFAYRPADGGPDVITAFGTANDGSLPTPGDYDGSGKTEIAIYDPNYASFAYRPADGGSDVIFAFGSAGVGASIPTATPPGALPEFNGVVAAASVNPAVSTLSVAVPSGPSLGSRRLSLNVVNQGVVDPNEALG
jgi:Domain of unknown function (DUF5122) beta-propeller